jgi:hypothetical protein
MQIHKAEGGKGWNPRYVLFAQAHGHRPDEQLANDDVRWPGGSMAGFINWIGERWTEFCQVHGFRNADQARLHYGALTDQVFDAWLAKTVAKGAARGN